jgi:hypothetical protein
MNFRGTLFPDVPYVPQYPPQAANACEVGQGLGIPHCTVSEIQMACV